MARQRRTLDEQIADLAMRGRTARTETLSVPAMAPLGPTLIDDNAILNEHLSAGAVALENLDDSIKDTLESLSGNELALADAQRQLDESSARIDDLFEDVATLPDQLASAKREAIEAAQAYTDANAGGGVTPEELEALRQDAQAKADAALTAAKTYAEAQASNASGAALEAAKLDASTKANNAKAAAITAAEADATAKANAAKTAAEATAASDATTKMNNVANSKNATFYGTAAPTATAPKGGLAGDTYRRRNAAGNIIGEWEWVITNSVGAWVQRKMTSESMTAVDVGVLTAGTAAIQDAVAQKLAAATATIQKADIGNLTVTGTTNLADTVARTIAANTGKFIQLSTDQLVAGSAVMDQAVVNKLYADVVQSRQIVADKVKAGAVDGQRIIGASVETSSAPDKGVKLSDAGVIAYGKTTRTEVTRPGVPAGPVTYNNRARLTQLANEYSVGAADIWPGLWFEAEREDGIQLTPTPKWKAGVTVSDPDATGIAVKSSKNPLSGDQATLTVGTGGLGVSSRTATGNTFMDVGGGYASIVTSTAPAGKTLSRLEVTPVGVNIAHGEGDTRRIPLGLIHHWKATAELNLYKNNPIFNATVKVPRSSNCRVDIILRGYPNTNNQLMQVIAYADGVAFGENTHFSPMYGSGTDCRVSFFFKEKTMTARDVRFLIQGSVAVPGSNSNYIVPAPANSIPNAEIMFTDLGDL